MKKCKECGYELPDTAKFCSQCRAKQEIKEAPETVNSRNEKPQTKSKKAPKKTTKSSKKTPAKKKKAPKKTVPTYQEIKDAIYEMTPQDNCGDCGCKNCMQFAMQAASRNNPMDISDCPYIDIDDDDDEYPIFLQKL